MTSSRRLPSGRVNDEVVADDHRHFALRGRSQCSDRRRCGNRVQGWHPRHRRRAACRRTGVTGPERAPVRLWRRRRRSPISRCRKFPGARRRNCSPSRRRRRAGAIPGVGALPDRLRRRARPRSPRSLPAMSGPDVNLSPALEAQAHALGRAIADKIVAYVLQQGLGKQFGFARTAAGGREAARRRSRRSLPAAVARQGDAAAATEHASMQRIHERPSAGIGTSEDRSP